MSKVANKFLAQMPAHTIKGNNTGSTANSLDLTATQVTAELNTFTSSLKGLVPSSGGGTANYLRADGTFATPPGAASTTYLWTGYHGTTTSAVSGWSNSSATFSDPANYDSTITFNQVNNVNFGTVTSYGGTGAAALPGIIFTPPVTGYYFVKASLTMNHSGANNESGARLWDGTTVIDASQTNFPGSGNTQVYFPTTLSGIINITSLSPRTISIQSAITGGGIYMGANIFGSNHYIDWSIQAVSPTPTVIAASGLEFYQSSAITTQSTNNNSTSWTTFSNSPAFTFTPTLSGTYKVYSNPIIEQTNPADSSLQRIHNTSGGATLLAESTGQTYVSAGGTIVQNVSLQSIYTLTAGISYVFDIQSIAVTGAVGTFMGTGGIVSFYMFAERVGV
jgi:hypothetical protein